MSWLCSIINSTPKAVSTLTTEYAHSTCTPFPFEKQERKCFQEGRSDNCIICHWKMTLRSGRDCPGFMGALINVCEKKLCKYLHLYFLFLILRFSYENSFLWRVTFALVQCHSRSFMVAGVRNPFQSSLGQRVAFLDWHNWKVWSTLASNTTAFRGPTEGHQSSVSFF